jgi:hypothetical protein
LSGTGCSLNRAATVIGTASLLDSNIIAGINQFNKTVQQNVQFDVLVLMAVSTRRVSAELLFFEAVQLSLRAMKGCTFHV